MDAVWNSFFREMEKIAINPMTVAMHSMNLLNLKGKIQEAKQTTTLNPITRDAATSNLKLKSPYQYQFEGGKKTGLTETTTPHTF